MNTSISESDNTVIRLRNVMESDLSIFFGQQLDGEANRMAAFTTKDPEDRSAFTAHWNRTLQDKNITVQTIIYNDHVAGHVLSYQNEDFDGPEVSYWLGKPYWGKNIATQALSLFLMQFNTRPNYARVVYDNIASQRVLEKCGFVRIDTGKGFANARGKEVEELIWRLQ